MSLIGDLSAAGFGGKTVAQVLTEIKESISTTATDDEVEDIINDVFESSDEDDEGSGSTATDDEVEEVLDDVFGPN